MAERQSGVCHVYPERILSSCCRFRVLKDLPDQTLEFRRRQYLDLCRGRVGAEYSGAVGTCVVPEEHPKFERVDVALYVWQVKAVEGVHLISRFLVIIGGDRTGGRGTDTDNVPHIYIAGLLEL